MDASRAEANLHRAALGLVLALPVALFYGRAVAEGMMAAVAVLFLLSATGRAGAWLRAPWVWATGVWWGWYVLCSALGVTGWHGFGQAVAAIRFPIFAAALAFWVLTTGEARRWLLLAVSLAGAWLVLQCWQQYVLGANIFGVPRFGDGALTGPFAGPRAGGTYILLFFPAVLPWVVRLGEGGAALRAAGFALLVLAVATMVLIGQRMPTLLMVLGLGLTALLLPRLRLAALVALGLGALVLAATPLISPPTFAKLVVKFWDQVSNFAASSYGLLYIRAINITELHPWMGAGHDGFRALCNDPATILGLPGLGITPEAATSKDACNIHPHNFYLEAATAGGWPGMALFALAAASWIATAGQGIRGGRDAVATALFVQLVVALWPLASTNGYLSVPNVGWLFLVLGWALAAARARAQGRA